MKQKKKSISTRLRKKILQESNESGCVVSDIANRYGIRKERLYRWRGEASKTVATPVKAVVEKHNFVEAKVENISEEKKVSKKSKMLRKASLEFENFTLSMEGSFDVEYIKQMLEVVSC
jgi:transposase-like protein